MLTRTLGTSRLRVSTVGIGTFNTIKDKENLTRVLHKALDLGVNFIDTAETYGNGKVEETIGRALRGNRDKVVLATKWGGVTQSRPETDRPGSEAYIRQAVEGSLQRLQTDYIDLYQYHHLDRKTPLEETFATLAALTREGKIRYVGVSNMPAWRVVQSYWIARNAGLENFVTCQDHYSLLTRRLDQDSMAAMKAHKLSLLPYYPLEAGLLTGKYRRGGPMPEGGRLSKNPDSPNVRKRMSDTNWDKIERLTRFAADRGGSLLELSIAWLASNRVVASIIAGVTSPEQLAQNVAALDWELTREDLAEVDRITAADRA